MKPTLPSRQLLLQLCVQWCEPDKGKAGEAMVKTILPTILETGICHQVSEVRAIRYTFFYIIALLGPMYIEKYIQGVNCVWNI